MHNKELDVFRSKNSKILNEKRRLDSNSYQEFFSDILETSLEKGEEEIIKENLRTGVCLFRLNGPMQCPDWLKLAHDWNVSESCGQEDTTDFQK